MRIGIVNALFFCIKRPARATLPKNRPRRQCVMPQRWQGAQLDLEAADIAIVDSPSDQADAVVRTLARPARGARDAEKESEAEVG